MHTLNRSAVGAVLFLALAPLLSLAAVGTGDGSGTLIQQKIQTALDSAKNQYEFSNGIREARLMNKEMIKQAEKHLVEIEKQRREYRLRIAYIKQQLQKLHVQSSGALLDLENTQQSMEEETAQFRDFVRYAHLKSLTDDAATDQQGIQLAVSQLIGSTMGEKVDDELRTSALRRARQELILGIVDSQEELDQKIAGLNGVARAYAEKLLITQALYEQSEKDYNETLKNIAIASNEVGVSDEQKQQETALANEVNTQVQNAQSELDRINSRTERRVERDLIRLKLLNPRTGEYVEKAPVIETGSYDTEFIWPVKGPISAGFRDPNYLKYFGFNHNAIDIVTHQLTSVRATADGVVLVAKDGGAKGFSYVLIGHAGGFTSLYGHLFEIDVRAGQEIQQGQIIGLSGGAPGTHGAGPYTTGSHLHFQMTRNGGYIDPRTVLP